MVKHEPLHCFVPGRWAGLIRGAVSVALVYYQFDRTSRAPGARSASHRSTVIATTLAETLFSVLALGALPAAHAACCWVHACRLPTVGTALVVIQCPNASCKLSCLF